MVLYVGDFCYRRSYSKIPLLLDTTFVSTSRIPDSIDLKYIVDTTLRPFPEYLEDTMDCRNYNTRPVSTVEEVFLLLKPNIISLIREQYIWPNVIAYINLVDNDIWVVNVVLPQEKQNNIQAFGGSVYYEVKKSNGCILKAIIGE